MAAVAIAAFLDRVKRPRIGSCRSPSSFLPLPRPIRALLPDFGGLDFSPLVVLILIQVVSMLLDGAEASLMTGTM